MKLLLKVILLTFVMSGLVFANGAEESKDVAEKTPVIVYLDLYRTPQDTEASAYDDKIVELINRTHNVDFQRIAPPREQHKETIALRLASGDQLDYFTPGGGGFSWLEYKTRGEALLPLDDLLNQYGENLLREIDGLTWEFSTFPGDGKIYAIPQKGFPTKRLLFIRQDWLDKLGIDTPSTIDELEMVMDLIKNAEWGEEGEYPYLSTGPWQTQLDIFLSPFIPSGRANWKDSKGIIKSYFLHPGFKDYLETMSRWYKKGLIHPEEYVMNNTQSRAAVAQGVSGVLSAWYTHIRWNTDIRDNNPDGNLVPIEPVSGTYKGKTTAASLVVSQKVITRSSNNAAKVMQILDWTVSETDSFPLALGIEGDTFDWIDKVNRIYRPRLDANGNRMYNMKYMWSGALDLIAMNIKEERPPGEPDPYQASFILREDVLIPGLYPTHIPVDYSIPYELSDTSAGDVEGDLNTFIEETIVKIITGAEPISYYEEAVETYMNMGGKVYEEEINSQFSALSK